MGRGYPFATTAAKPHDHRFCPVVEAIGKRARAGHELWGTPHTFTVNSVEAAEEARKGIYRARKHDWSITCNWQEEEDGTFTVTCIVWGTKETGKAYIAAKVARGEKLAYNPRRKIV